MKRPEYSSEELWLGKLPAIADAHDFSMMAVLDAQPYKLPKVPTRFGHGLSFHEWGMLGNGPDETVAPAFRGCGDCVWAGAAHEHMIAANTQRKVLKFTGRNVVDDYADNTGYVIGNDSTDNGTVVSSAMRFRRKTGIMDAAGKRHKIGAYVSFDPQDWETLRVATYFFDYVGIGFEFPTSAWEDWDAGVTWDLHDMDNAGIDGGHYVPIVGIPRRDVCSFVTWGIRTTMTRRFYEMHNDESWAYVTPESLARGHNDRGLDLAHLHSLLGQLK